jgi:hypothetical protein
MARGNLGVAGTARFKRRGESSPTPGVALTRATLGRTERRGNPHLEI